MALEAGELALTPHSVQAPAVTKVAPLPDCAMYFPASQAVQAELPATADFPASQAVQSVAAPAPEVPLWA